MPANKSKPAPLKPKDWQVEFVSCELDKSTKEQVKLWDVKYEATYEAFDRMIMAGYKVSFSHDKYHDCCGAFCTMPDPAHEHHGFCLTARGPNFLEAMKVLVYKHFKILDEKWDTEVDQPRSRDPWG